MDYMVYPWCGISWIYKWKFLRISSVAICNPFQSSVAFNMETSYLICTANQMTGFYMKCNTGMISVNKVAAIQHVAGNLPWRCSNVVVTLNESCSACGVSWLLEFSRLIRTWRNRMVSNVKSWVEVNTFKPLFPKTRFPPYIPFLGLN